MPQTKILLTEDDENLGMILKEFLEIKGFEVIHALDGFDGFEKFKSDKFNICILDVMMPRKDGFTLAKEIRAIDEFTPIIFLTAKSMQHDRIEGFKIGADDYITKPFSTEELLLRINAILKRINNSSKPEFVSNETLFDIGQYRFDYERRILSLKGKELKLTSKEADLLRLLCLHKNSVLERTTALKQIWKTDSYFAGRSMDVYIVKLRHYLEEDKKIEIVNIHGTGFKMID